MQAPLRETFGEKADNGIYSREKRMPGLCRQIAGTRADSGGVSETERVFHADARGRRQRGDDRDRKSHV